MKHFPTASLLVAAALLCIPTAALATLSIEHALPPITNTNATQHDFTITYLSLAGIDTHKNLRFQSERKDRDIR